ncbi:hypothetical protein SAMN06295905_0048 [Devosia lucknowensis]|uniref:Uncharacterized protein n=1 Tax=Devosia lucknowensis TaxID=1096929 RepID=A0A1Y6ECB1_9HYPH|nr:hypothetical protein SAMN06295905_0048 [Devosia lucknowensis]
MIPPRPIRYTGNGSTQIYSNPIMSTQTRDSLALYAIAALAVIVTMYADIDLNVLFQSILARF